MKVTNNTPKKFQPIILEVALHSYDELCELFHRLNIPLVDVRSNRWVLESKFGLSDKGGTTLLDLFGAVENEMYRYTRTIPEEER